MKTETLEQRETDLADTAVPSFGETDTARAIDEMLQHFDRHMRDRLISSISEGESTDQEITNAIRRCFKEQEYKQFQLDVLGVCGGAFGLSHNSRRNFILFQTNAVQPADIKGTRLPYLSRTINPDEYEDLIDWFFLGKRRLQPLFGNQQNSFSPEFYWQLAQIYHPQYQLFEQSPFSEYLQKRRSPYVYCAIGEVAFFLYCWRWLFRQLQRSGSLSEYSGRLLLNADQPYKCMDIWNKTFWKQDGRLCPELEWLGALDELDRLGQENEIKEEIPTFQLNVRKQWDRWRAELDTNPAQFHMEGEQQPWKTDWYSLGLLQKGPERDLTDVWPSNTLLSLIRFARCIDKSEDPLLERFEKTIKQAIVENSGIGRDELEELDGVIQKVALRFLRGKGNSNLGSLLSELHGLARFPILPFFYWTAVDRQPKEHFVFPVWESWRFPVEIRVPKNRGGKPSLMVPAVGIALIAIRPMNEFGLPSFDRFHADHEEVFSEAHRRLYRIERFFVRVVRPLIDAAFYGTLIRDTAHSEGRAEQVESWAHALQTKLTLLQVLYDRLSADAEQNQAVMVKQDTWINIGGSLNSLRRTMNALSYYNRVRRYLRKGNKDFVSLRQNDEAGFSAFNRGLGHLLLDAFHLMAAKVRLGDQKYGDLKNRLPSFTMACKSTDLPPLKTEFDMEYPISFQELQDFFPSDHSVEFNLQVPKGTSLENFEVWQEVELPASEPISFCYDTVVGVVIDEIFSNACKHVNKLEDQQARITIDLQVEMDNNDEDDLGWARLTVTNTAAFKGFQSDFAEGRSLLDDWRKGKGLGLFFNRELSQTLTGDAENFAIHVDVDLRHVVSTFRFPVIYSPSLT